MSHQIIFDADLEMKTRDGVILRADVMRPNIKSKVPAIVARTPYSKDSTFYALRYLPPLKAAQAGYAVVIQDIRGRYKSEGEWDLKNLTDANTDDGYDCIEWVASLDWCDGNVGMAGGSYVGESQIAAALTNPPHLRAIAPSLIGIGKTRALDTGSVPLESMTIGWWAGMAIDHVTKLIAKGEAGVEAIGPVLEALKHPDVAAQALPLSDLVTVEGVGLADYTDSLGMVAASCLRKGEEEALIHCPTLWTSGWYDNAVGAEQFTSMRTLGATAVARSDTRMILGPWTHNYAQPFVGCLGLGFLGSSDGAGVPQLHLRYYDRHLRGADTDIPVVRYFVMGANEWRNADDWPIPGTEFQRWYLHSRGDANSAAGGGVLSRDEPTADESPDRYTYDPIDPVPSWGHRVMYTGGTTCAGPYEQDRVERRSDVLVYTSPPFTASTEIVGDVDVTICFSTDVSDTDFIAKLCVVWPDGTSLNLADGLLRARHRNGYENTELITPGDEYSVNIPLGPTGYRLEAGMSIRVQIASSAFPHWERNMNTGNTPGADAVGPVANITIHHDRSRPSYVTIPVQPNPSPEVLPDMAIL